MPEQDEPFAGEPVGSLAEEAARLVAAMMTGGGAGNGPAARGSQGAEGAGDHDGANDGTGGGSGSHSCPHGWCPLCQAVEYVQDHPEVVTQVLVAGAEFLKVVRDAVEKVTGSHEEPT